ncbi:hypothetical protein AQUCO_05200009v1 [Aquilegia coerulea]|uniref:Uncharacterized protein n=1 Tax=Aquilegia coerulea TaxID=218851 RepID=A0A2G5CIN2_AQUCA|nr:hypothetical protein AQUCO_05200009v1 [Aquilegia coerulea]
MIIERVITIEYLQPSMSQQLLCKFPDQSAFDFDYTQSGIWSPLLPRGGQFTLSDISPLDLKRKLLGDDKNEEFPPQEKLKKVGSKIKNKMMKAMTKKKKKNNGLDFSPVIARKSSTPKKVWRKALKAASKPFKKHTRLHLL